MTRQPTASSTPPAPTRRWRVGVLVLLALVLSACETVTETLVINETGSGSLIIDWSYDPNDPEQASEIGAANATNAPISRQQLGVTIDEAFDTSGYVLNDRVAFSEIRAARTGFTITKPLTELDDLETLGRTGLETGRVPSMLWHEIDITEADDGSFALTSTPSVADRQAVLEWAREKGVDPDPMVFVAAFEVRGQILSHNADEIDGNRLVWRLEGAEPANLEVAWLPVAPEATSAAPFAAGLLAIIALVTGGLYLWEKRNLDRHEVSDRA